MAVKELIESKTKDVQEGQKEMFTITLKFNREENKDIWNIGTKVLEIAKAVKLSAPDVCFHLLEEAVLIYEAESEGN